MKNTLKLLIALALASCAFGQLNTMFSTTLSAAVTTTSQSSVCLTSLTNVVAPSTAGSGSEIFVDREAMLVNGPLPSTGTCVPVQRGYNGTPTQTHQTLIWVWFGDPTWFIEKDVSEENWGGSCTKSTLFASPIINTRTGSWKVCDSKSRLGYAGPFGDGGTAPMAETDNAGTAAYTVLATDEWVNLTGLTATRIFTLPSAVALPGKRFHFTDATLAGTSMVLLELNAANGSATFSCIAAAPQSSCDVVSNGTIWISVN